MDKKEHMQPMPTRPTRHAIKKEGSPPPRWPLRILALLVVGFCLLVGGGSFHLVLESVGMIDPRDPATFAAAREAMDTGYAKGLFAEPATQAPQAAEGEEPVQAESRPSLQSQLQDAFVDINGMATGALGQRELNGVVKLDNGYITQYLTEKQDLSHQIAKTVELWSYVQSQGKQFVFVMAPHLISKYQPLLPAGVTDCHNEMADEFLAALAANGVPYIDLRELMQNEGYDHYEGFFHTDHHWKPHTAAWAADRTMRTLQGWGWLNTAELGVTPEAFGQAYEGQPFYGTAAERTGHAFAGQPDVLECLVPSYETVLSIRHYVNESEFSAPMSMEELYRGFAQHAQPGQTLGPDAYYLYSTAYETVVRNEQASADNSITLVCDSFGVSFQSFMSCYTRQLIAFDGRVHPDLAPAIDQSDIVMVLLNPQSLDIRTENTEIFSFVNSESGCKF